MSKLKPIVCLFAFAALPISGFGQFQLPTSQEVEGTITQGFNENDHSGKSAYAVDIGIKAGTKIVAPVDGYVTYGRFQNGNFSTRAGMYQQIFPGICPALVRDDDPNSANALWTVVFQGYSTGEIWTVFHVSEQPLRNPDDQSGPIWVTGGTTIAKTGGLVDEPGRGCSTGQHMHIAKLAWFEPGVSPAAIQSVSFDLGGKRWDPRNSEYAAITVSATDLDWNYGFNAYRQRINGTASEANNPDCGSKVMAGSCSSNPQPWLEAYSRNGFNFYVTGAMNSVHKWGAGCIQDFNATDSNVHDALMQPECTGVVSQIYGGMWDRYTAAGGATSFIGYPLEDRIPVWSGASGLSADTQRFQGATMVLHTDWRSPWKGTTFAVQGAIRDEWSQLGGTSSFLGLPLSDEYTGSYDFDWGSWQWKRVQRTEFERGYILWHERDGSNEVQQY